MATTSLSQRHDLTRPEIIEVFRKRIDQGQRTKLSRDERGILALILCDQLIQMAHDGIDTPEAIRKLCLNEIRLLEEGYPQSSLNSNYLPEYTRIIKAAIADERLPLNEQNSYDQEWIKRDGSRSGVERRHYALDFLTYDLRTQRELRNVTTERNNIRQDNLAPVELDEYIDTIETLLTSDDPIELIIAIAAVTGRRHTEVVSLGQFEAGQGTHLNLQGHPYLLRFAGQQKKAEPIVYDILTLVPAVDVLEAINRLREQPELIELAGKPYDDPDIKAMVARVDRKVHTLLGKTNIVPLVEGFQTVSIHRLRGLYGAIAIHYFCPQHQREHRFLQHYLGHVLDGEILPNSRATDHYFHYNLVREGKVLSARGVKIPSAGLFPTMQDNFIPPEEEPPTPIEDEIEAAQPTEDEPIPQHHPEPDTEDIDTMDRALVETLQTIAKQQSQTIETQAETIAQLQQQQQDLLAQTHAPAVSYEQPEPQPSHTQIIALEQTITHQKERIVVLERALKDAIAQKREVQQQLAQIRSVFNLPSEANGSPSSELQNAPKVERHQSPGRPPENPEKSVTYRRAVRTWELTQQWNREQPDKAIQLSKSLLTREFGIHAKAIKTFFDKHITEIEAENKRLGIEDGDIQFNKGDKLDDYFDFVKPILKQENLIRT